MIEVNARGEPIMVLDQILVDDNTYLYVDRATGRRYTATEARGLKAPNRVLYVGERR